MVIDGLHSAVKLHVEQYICY